MSEPGKDIDSAGVYLIEVDDFEWKPSTSDGGSSYNAKISLRSLLRL